MPVKMHNWFHEITWGLWNARLASLDSLHHFVIAGHFMTWNETHLPSSGDSERILSHIKPVLFSKETEIVLMLIALPSKPSGWQKCIGVFQSLFLFFLSHFKTIPPFNILYHLFLVYRGVVIHQPGIISPKYS